jgi:hypothetical protein
LSKTALVATVSEEALMASALMAGLSRIPIGARARGTETAIAPRVEAETDGKETK